MLKLDKFVTRLKPTMLPQRMLKMNHLKMGGKVVKMLLHVKNDVKRNSNVCKHWPRVQNHVATSIHALT